MDLKELKKTEEITVIEKDRECQTFKNNNRRAPLPSNRKKTRGMNANKKLHIITKG